MYIKVLHSVLVVFAVFMGIKQGYSMLTSKPEITRLFDEWHFNKGAVSIIGIVTILSAVLILHPKTFFWGNFLMAATILLFISFHVNNKDLRGAAIETPFLLMNLLIIYLQHPFASTG